MKNTVKEFLRRGIAACGFGPMVLAVLYLILQHNGIMDSLTVHEVCIGIFSLSALAFIAGGMNAVYQIERLPLMAAVFIHGGVLYLSYLAAYLVNDWLKEGIMPLVIFTAIFVVGYAVVWVCIYLATRSDTAQINKKLHPQG